MAYREGVSDSDRREDLSRKGKNDYESNIRDEGGSGKIYIGNLPPEVKETDIRKDFREYGPIISVESKGKFAFVEYENEGDAAEAQRSMNGQRYFGDRISVYPHNESRQINPPTQLLRPSNNRKPSGKDRRTDYRVLVFNLDDRVSWQDLKDFGRNAGDVNFANVFTRAGRNVGVIEYFDLRTMERALDRLHYNYLYDRRVYVEEDRGQLDGPGHYEPYCYRRSRRDKSRSRSRERYQYHRDKEYRDYGDRDYRDKEYKEKEYRNREYRDEYRENRDREYRDRDYRDREYRERRRDMRGRDRREDVERAEIRNREADHRREGRCRDYEEVVDKEYGGYNERERYNRDEDGYVKSSRDGYEDNLETRDSMTDDYENLKKVESSVAPGGAAGEEIYASREADYHETETYAKDKQYVETYRHEKGVDEDRQTEANEEWSHNRERLYDYDEDLRVQDVELPPEKFPVDDLQ